MKILFHELSVNSDGTSSQSSYPKDQFVELPDGAGEQEIIEAYCLLLNADESEEGIDDQLGIWDQVERDEEGITFSAFEDGQRSFLYAQILHD